MIKICHLHHRGTHRKERLEMAQWWGYYIGQMTDGGGTIAIIRKGTT